MPFETVKKPFSVYISKDSDCNDKPWPMYMGMDENVDTHMSAVTVLPTG